MLLAAGRQCRLLRAQKWGTSPGCDWRRPIHIPCGYRPNSLIAGGTTNTKRNTEHAGRHLWSLVSAVSLGGVFQREHPVQRTAAGFLREGELRTHWVAETERSANTHSASPATKALDRPARKCQERQVSSCSRKGSGAHATACVQRAGLGISSVRQMQRVRTEKQDLGMGSEPRELLRMNREIRTSISRVLPSRLCSAEGTVLSLTHGPGEGQAWNLQPHAY